MTRRWWFRRSLDDVAVLALLLLLPPGRPARPLRWLGLSLLLLTAIELTNLLLSQKWGKPMTSWYGWLPLATSMVTLALGLLHRLPERAIRHPDRQTLRETPWIHYIRSTPPSTIWSATDCGRLAYWGERRFVVHSYLYGVESDTLHLSPRAEVWRSEAFRDGAAQARYLMFELPDPGKEGAPAVSGSQPPSAM